MLEKGLYKSDSLLMLAAIIWGSAFVAQRVGMSYVGPLTFNGVRFALGAIVLLPLVRWRNQHQRVASSLQRASLARQSLWGGGLAGLILFSGATLQQIGLVYTTAGKAGFITGLYVIIVPLMGLFLGHWPGWGGWVGACCATIGLYLLSVTEAWTFAPGDLLGIVWCLFLGCTPVSTKLAFSKNGEDYIGLHPIFSVLYFESSWCVFYRNHYSRWYQGCSHSYSLRRCSIRRHCIYLTGDSTKACSPYSRRYHS